MSKTKKSLKLPIVLIVGPTLGLLLAVFLYAVLNFVFAGSGAATSSDISLSEGASIAQGAESSEDLFVERPIFMTIANIVLYLLGAVSVLAIIPCLVIGIIMLVGRLRNRHTRMDENKSRTWGDVE